MYKIKGNKAYYIEKKNNKDEDNINKQFVIPIPKIKKQGILSFSEWKYKYNDIIENIYIEFIKSILKVNSEKFIYHIDISNIKIAFIKKMYETSHNSSKYYP